ncbi:MAG: sialate O-acetylesterase [Lachnospiraceae bacterium]|nr:sialate O-acetylesterase [Lachnospiraceae bacterium]
MLKAAMIFGNHMTLQREKTIKIWGTSDADADISIQLSDVRQPVLVKSSETGDWMALLPPHTAAEGLTLTILSGEEKLIFTDVRVGEVWLAGGQSNMEYMLAFDAERETVLKDCRKEITFFDYPKVSYEGELEQLDYSRFGIWRTCTPQNLPYYSAVGYYFAVQIQEKLKVPVGIIGCNWGGTPSCAWVKKEDLPGTKGECWLREFEKGLKKLDVETYQKTFHMNPGNDHTNPFEENIQKQTQCRMFYPGLTRKEQLQMLEMMQQYMGEAFTAEITGPWSEKAPGALYENMLTKTAPYSIRGIIFYQGESDDIHAEAYKDMLNLLITSWRKLWGEELPFLMVQLAPFGEWLTSTGTAYPVLRKAQDDAAKELTDVYLCSSSDSGMEFDIHPKQKRPIGERLALLAENHVYQEAVLADPPEAVSCKRRGEKIIISFRNGQGLRIDGEKLEALEVWDEKEHPATIERAEIEGESLILTGNFPAKAVVSLAWKPYYKVNLYNRAKNPAKPFKMTVE